MLTDEHVGGEVCQRCDQRPGMVTWSPLFASNLCPACRDYLSAREVAVTTAALPVQRHEIPAGVLSAGMRLRVRATGRIGSPVTTTVVQVTDEIEDRQAITR